MTKKTFTDMCCLMFSGYEMLHRRVVIDETDTFVMEGLLEPGSHPVCDTLWARAILEGFPNGTVAIVE